MKKKAIILDLDNTIYPVSSIGEELFQPLFKLIGERGEHTEELEAIKEEIMRRPFQDVARDYGFSDELLKEGSAILQGLTYDKKMAPFDDYEEVRRIPCKKFLVTTGFTRMQQSKVEQLGIAADFEEVHIIDPEQTDRKKKDIFEDIIDRHCFQPSDVLVVGDDPDSEIQAALELEVDAVLYDKINVNPDTQHPHRITDFKQLHDYT